jgi:plastocyanin domain-containing protein
MGSAELAVPVGGMASTAALTWHFFASKTAQPATVRGGVQGVGMKVKGGYSPHLVRVTAGGPVRLIFDRQDNSGCTERVVFPDFSLGRSLAAVAKTPVEFTPTEPGEYGWACGRKMLHGKVIGEATDGDDDPADDEAEPFAEAVRTGPPSSLSVVVDANRMRDITPPVLSTHSARASGGGGGGSEVGRPGPTALTERR